MILKVWDTNPNHNKGWVYFDHVEKLRIVHHGSTALDENLECAGGIFATITEGDFRIAEILRTWDQRGIGECITLAFNEGYLLGDDGKTIERL